MTDLLERITNASTKALVLVDDLDLHHKMDSATRSTVYQLLAKTYDTDKLTVEELESITDEIEHIHAAITRK